MAPGLRLPGGLDPARCLSPSENTDLRSPIPAVESRLGKGLSLCFGSGFNEKGVHLTVTEEDLRKMRGGLNPGAIPADGTPEQSKDDGSRG